MWNIPKYRLSMICFFSHMNMKYGKIRIWFCLYTIYKKIQIRESPYLGIFHAVLLWCFFCWLWTNSCCARRYFTIFGWWLLLQILEKRKKSNSFNRLQIEVSFLPNVSPPFPKYRSIKFVLCPYIHPGRINGILQYIKNNYMKD